MAEIPKTTLLDYSTGTRKQFDESAYADIVSTTGGYTSMCITIKPGFDWRKSVSPLLPGCPEWCPATHFGFLKSGCMKVKYEDGTEKTVNAGSCWMGANRWIQKAKA